MRAAPTPSQENKAPAPTSVDNISKIDVLRTYQIAQVRKILRKFRRTSAFRATGKKSLVLFILREFSHQ